MTDKDKKFWQRLGRGNKNRGRAFEKKVAAVLGFTRVPYSGGAAAWGAGDVVDGFYSRNGLWFLECKTQPKGPGNVSIRKKWIDRCLKAARLENRIPAIVTSLYGESVAYVFLPYKSMFRWTWTASPVDLFKADVVWFTRVRGHGGFCLQASWIRAKWRLAFVQIEGATTGLGWWYVMRLDEFARLLKVTGFYVEDKEPTS